MNNHKFPNSAYLKRQALLAIYFVYSVLHSSKIG